MAAFLADHLRRSAVYRFCPMVYSQGSRKVLAVTIITLQKLSAVDDPLPHPVTAGQCLMLIESFPIVPVTLMPLMPLMLATCHLLLQARAALLGVLLPLMRVLTHEDVRTDPTQANPVLSTLHDALSLADLSTRLEELSTDPAADGEGFIRQQLQQLGGMVCCTYCLGNPMVAPMSLAMHAASMSLAVSSELGCQL